MKILRKILYLILGLLSLLSLFIIICAFNPALADKASDLLYGGAARLAGEAANTDNIKRNAGAGSDDADAFPTLVNNVLPSGTEADNYGTDEYVQPDRASVEVPEELAGKSGYVPVQEASEQIDDSEAEKLREQYTYGETGEDVNFDTAFYPYYGMLEENQQKLYRQIYANANAVNGIFNPVVEVPVSQLKNVFLAVINDHPELFWLDSAYRGRFDSRGVCVEIVLQFNNLVDNLDEAKNNFNAAANEILAGADGLGSDYDKEVYVHNALLDRIEYDLQAPYNQSAYSALVNDRTVCAGYARALQYLMTQLGVPCYYCTGYAGQNHAWNIIRLDGEFYNVDTTWDDTDPNTYDYFNKSDADFISTHMREDLSIYLPPCNGTKYSNLESNQAAERTTAEENQEYYDTRRTLEEAGGLEEYVIGDMEAYYDDCKSQILANGGSCRFQNIVDDLAMGEACLNIYNDNAFGDAYMHEVLAQLGASGCEIYVTAEELRDGRILLNHEVSIF